MEVFDYSRRVVTKHLTHQTFLDHVEIRTMSQKRETQTLNTLALGLCLGIILGAILKNIILGLCLGLVLDAIFERRKKGAAREQ